MTRERGRWLERSDGRKVLITLHPSALLRVDPEDKAAAYAAWLGDLRKAAAHFSRPEVVARRDDRSRPTARTRRA